MMSLRFRSRCSLMILCTVAVAVAVAACSREGGKTAYPERFGVDAAPPTRSAPIVPLRIVDYGPQWALRGKAFNVQPDGVSALWVKLSRPLDKSVTHVILAGKQLVTTSQGATITAVVPLELISTSGRLKLSVMTREPGGEPVQSNDVPFEVR